LLRHQESYRGVTLQSSPGNFIRPPPGLEQECGLHLPLGAELIEPVALFTDESEIPLENQEPDLTAGESKVGTSELPSVGSMLHNKGQCKPCVFFHSKDKGCGAGKGCEFCHLCPEGEKLRRKKEKKEMMKLQRNNCHPQSAVYMVPMYESYQLFA